MVTQVAQIIPLTVIIDQKKTLFKLEPILCRFCFFLISTFEYFLVSKVDFDFQFSYSNKNFTHGSNFLKLGLFYQKTVNDKLF